jgi:hypothetical protein
LLLIQGAQPLRGRQQRLEADGGGHTRHLAPAANSAHQTVHCAAACDAAATFRRCKQALLLLPLLLLLWVLPLLLLLLLPLLPRLGRTRTSAAVRGAEGLRVGGSNARGPPEVGGLGSCQATGQ